MQNSIAIFFSQGWNNSLYVWNVLLSRPRVSFLFLSGENDVSHLSDDVLRLSGLIGSCFPPCMANDPVNAGERGQRWVNRPLLRFDTHDAAAITLSHRF